MNILIDAESCTGCVLCSLICSLVKEGECNPSKARIYCESYMIEGLRYPRVCINCAEPACVEVCPTGALRKEEMSGYVVFDVETCTRCGACVEACEFGGIRLSPEGDVIKCDLCGGDPQCVRVCATGAIRFAERQPQRLTRARKGLTRCTEEVVQE